MNTIYNKDWFYNKLDAPKEFREYKYRVYRKATGDFDFDSVFCRDISVFVDLIDLWKNRFWFDYKYYVGWS